MIENSLQPVINQMPAYLCCFSLQNRRVLHVELR